MRISAGWLRCGFLAATCLGAAGGAARAQPFQGVYLGGAGGYNYRSQVLGNYPQDPQTRRLVTSAQDGYAGLGSIGYGFGNGVRLELEGNYRENDVNHVSGTAFPTSATGRLQTYGAMGNALFDFDIGVPWLFPYAGVGAGYAWTKLDGFSFANASVPFSLGTGSQTDGKLAYQAMAGLSFPIPNVPGLSLTAEYRFFGVTAGSEFPTSETTPAGTALSPSRSGLKLSAQYNHDALLGVRYAFGVTPPPLPPVERVPVQQVAPARSYLIFFDWDKAVLTDRARAIVREAADNSAHTETTRIEVDGYTDTSGTKQYNQALSLRRADAVAAELVKDGVPKAEIAVQGFGETKLLVQTGPGVREPQNRRVEIILK